MRFHFDRLKAMFVLDLDFQPAAKLIDGNQGAVQKSPEAGRGDRKGDAGTIAAVIVAAPVAIVISGRRGSRPAAMAIATIVVVAGVVVTTAMAITAAAIMAAAAMIVSAGIVATAAAGTAIATIMAVAGIGDRREE